MPVQFLSDLRRQATIHAEIKQRLMDAYGLDDDDQALNDTLEGVSDLKELCLRALREARRREGYAEAMKEVLAENKHRKERHEQAAERIRSIVADAMVDAGERKIEGPDMTITIRDGKPRQIINEAALPDRFKMAVTKMVPNKDAIQASLDVGIVPEGVQIANPKPVLTVRTR